MDNETKKLIARAEIRLVPYDWEHPVDADLEFIPLIDIGYEFVAKDWLENCIKWAKKIHPDQEMDSSQFYWDWIGPPPSETDYRPDWPESIMNCLQIYDSEDLVPMSPVFGSQQEIESWIMERWEMSKDETQNFIVDNPGPSLMMLADPELKNDYREAFQIY